jgi:hypothetical protein
MRHALEIALELRITIGAVRGGIVLVLRTPVPNDICFLMAHYSHQEGHQLLIFL